MKRSAVYWKHGEKERAAIYICMYVWLPCIWSMVTIFFLNCIFLILSFLCVTLVLWPMMQWSTVKFPLAFLCFWNCAFFAEHSLSKNHLAKKLGSSLISQLQTMSPLVISVAACSTHMLEKSSFNARLVSCRLLFLLHVVLLSAAFRITVGKLNNDIMTFVDLLFLNFHRNL